jgi:hypothetical protein
MPGVLLWPTPHPDTSHNYAAVLQEHTFDDNRTGSTKYSKAALAAFFAFKDTLDDWLVLTLITHFFTMF